MCMRLWVTTVTTDRYSAGSLKYCNSELLLLLLLLLLFQNIIVYSGNTRGCYCVYTRVLPLNFTSKLSVQGEVLALATPLLVRSSPCKFVLTPLALYPQSRLGSCNLSARVLSHFQRSCGVRACIIT
jgi:hypothetical protein